MRRREFLQAVTAGATLLTRDELEQFAHLAAEAGIEVVAIPGPRPNWETGSHVHSSWGMASGCRPRGAQGLVDLVADIIRCCEAGIKGFLLWGADCLWMLDRLRANGDIPRDVIFKVSYTAGHGNPAGAALLQGCGADSFNPLTDLELPMLASLRQATKIPLDIVVRAHEGLGGINRMWQAAEIVRVAAPVYLKQELFGRTAEKVRYCGILRELIQREHPQLKLSARRPGDLAIPQPPSGG